MSDIHIGSIVPDTMHDGASDTTTLNIGYGAAQDMITITSSGISPLTTGYSSASTIHLPAELVLDRWEMNQLVVEHKLQEQEMVKLKDTVPDYADHIKSNIAKEASKDLVKKMSFTKKKLPDEDVHHFLGRVYVFTKEELIKLIEDARNA